MFRLHSATYFGEAMRYRDLVPPIVMIIPWVSKHWRW